MASEEVKQQVSISSDKLEGVHKTMRAFSLSMRALFLENRTLTSSSEAAKFEKLRDDTRNDAVAYVKGGLPLVKQCVSDIKCYFEYYIDLTKDEWWTFIADIVEEVKARKEACNALVDIHEHFLSEVKTLQDDATILMEESHDLAAKYEEEASKLEMSALRKGAFCAALLLIPQLSGPISLTWGVEAISSPMTSMDQGTEKEKTANAEIAVVAAVRDTLGPALSEFISVLRCISGLFEVLQQELETIQEKGEKAMEGEKPKDIHYKVMNKNAGRIVNHFNDVIKELPSIRSDFQAIPIEGLDDHYVERLLLMANECISRHCTNTKMLNKMKTTLTTGNKKQVTMYSMREGRSLLEKYASFWGVSPQILFAVIVCVLIVLFAYIPRALLVLIFLAVLAYFVFV